MTDQVKEALNYSTVRAGHHLYNPGSVEPHDFSDTVELAAVGIVHVGPGGKFLYANPYFCGMLGYALSELLNLTVKEISFWEDGAVSNDVRERLASGDIESAKIEKRYIHKDGTIFWACTTIAVKRDTDGTVIHDIAVVEDISARKAAEQATAHHKRMFAALSSTNEAMIRAENAAELYADVCEAAVSGGEFLLSCMVLVDDAGFARTAAGSGRGVARLAQIEVSKSDQRNFGSGLVGRAYHTGNVVASNEFAQGKFKSAWQEATSDLGIQSAAGVPVRCGGECIGAMFLGAGDPGGFPDDIVELLQRMSENIEFALDAFEQEAERKRAEERIHYLATRDALTGLPNRAHFNELLNQMIKTGQRYERSFALLFVDLDRFKIINDTLGHDAGDQLLVEISQRFTSCLRESDIVARLGGDEFVVLLQEVNTVEQIGVVRTEFTVGCDGTDDDFGARVPRHREHRDQLVSG